MRAPAGAQLLERKDLSYAIAKAIAETPVESCKSKGYNVAVVVVGRAGETVRRQVTLPHVIAIAAACRAKYVQAGLDKVAGQLK